jgi:hypothetical protein
MKMTDLRAKARAIFGDAIAEPMPKQPNGAKALQQRANARPIPTYKNGGAIKKPTPPAPRTGGPEADDVLITTRRGQQILEEQRRREAMRDREQDEKRKRADRLLGIPEQKSGGKAGCGTYKKGGKVQTSADTAKKLATEMGGMKKGGISKKASGGRMISTGSPVSMRSTGAPVSTGSPVSMRSTGAPVSTGMPVSTRMPVATASPTAGIGGMSGESAVLKGRQESKKVSKKAVGGAMKKGGKAKDGLAVMIAIGKPMKKPVKKAAGGTGRANMRSEPAAKNTRGIIARQPATMPPTAVRPQPMPTQRPTPSPMPTQPQPPTAPEQSRVVDETNWFKSRFPTGYKKGGSPVKKAVGGAGKTRKGMAPIKKAQGGAAKVRKGMMTPEGNIIHVMNKMRGK